MWKGSQKAVVWSIILPQVKIMRGYNVSVIHRNHILFFTGKQKLCCLRQVSWLGPHSDTREDVWF